MQPASLHMGSVCTTTCFGSVASPSQWRMWPRGVTAPALVVALGGRACRSADEAGARRLASSARASSRARKLLADPPARLLWARISLSALSLHWLLEGLFAGGCCISQGLPAPAAPSHTWGLGNRSLWLSSGGTSGFKAQRIAARGCPWEPVAKGLP